MENRLNVVLKHVADKLQIKYRNYIQHQVNNAVENYFGILIPVTLIGENELGQIEKSLFVKFAPSKRIEQLKYVIRQHYQVEIYTYCTLLPIYKRLTNIDLNILFPKCYFTNLDENNEVLVLNDMRSKGYILNKERKLDVDHAVVSLKSLAKFHALSMIYKYRGEDFNTDTMKPYSHKHPEVYFQYIKDSLGQHINLFKNTKYEAFVVCLQSDLHRFVDRSTSNDTYLVYGHGDFWTENILFKYENSRPTHACVIDFQKSRIMCPAHDVLQFFLTSVQASVLHQHHEYLINYYINELCYTLQGHGLKDIYTIENLRRDFKTVAPYCIAIAIMAYSLWFGLEGGDIVKSKHECDDESKEQVKILFKDSVINILDFTSSLEYIDL